MRPRVTTISFLVFTNVVFVANSARFLTTSQHESRVFLAFTLPCPLCAAIVRLYTVLIVPANTATFSAIFPHPTGICHAVSVHHPSRTIFLFVLAFWFFVGANEARARAVLFHEVFELSIAFTKCFPIHAVLLFVVASVGVDGGFEWTASAATPFAFLHHKIGIGFTDAILSPGRTSLVLVLANGLRSRQTSVTRLTAKHPHPFGIEKTFFFSSP